LGGFVARAVNGGFDGYILGDFLAVSLELHDSALFDLGNLTASGHHVHDSTDFLNSLVLHNRLGVDHFDWAHLDLLFHFGVLDLVDNGLELRLLFVGVLVLDGLRFVGDCHNLLGRTGAVSLSRTATAAGRSSAGALLIEDLVEVGELRSGLVHDLLFAPRVEVILGEEPVEFISIISGLDQVSGIDDFLSGGDSAGAISTGFFHVAGKTARFFRSFLYGHGLGSGGNALLEVDRLAHGREGGLTASVYGSHLAHDIVTCAKIERRCPKVIILENPLCAISENSGKGLKGAMSVLALNVDLGDRST